MVRPCVGKTTWAAPSVFEANDLSVMIRICPEQGNEGIITAITVVGETVTVYCGERTVEYITWAEMAKSRTRSGNWLFPTPLEG